MIINVLPWREKKHVSIKKAFLNQGLIAVIIGLSIVFCAHFLLITDLNKQEKNNALLNSKINAYNQIIQTGAPAATLLQTIQQQKNVIALLKNKQAETLELFNLFQSLLPKDIYLTEINRAGNTITLIGNASHNEAISTFMNQLETSTNFNAVHLKKISAQKFEINLVEIS